MTSETVNGGVRIDQVGRHGTTTSTVGEGGMLSSKRRSPQPPLPDMSDAAWRLYRKQLADERKKKLNLATNQKILPPTPQPQDTITDYQPNPDTLPGTTERNINWGALDTMATIVLGALRGKK